MVSALPACVSLEEEYARADAVRVECFSEIRAMLHDGTHARHGQSFDLWMMRYLVAVEAQLRALAELERQEAECANLSR